ncbi:LuxR C-terminal-related transcriptional regulator, partial [Rhizobium ruizarguesonis]
CLQLACDGRISEEIADKLGLSVHTVNAYLGSATIKLSVAWQFKALQRPTARRDLSDSLVAL